MTKIARRLLVVAMLVGALGLMAGPALATAESGSQNPDLTVAVSLTNSGGGADGDVDTATAGESIAISGSIANQTARSQLVTVRLSLTGPDDFAVAYSVPFFVGAHRTAEISFDLPVHDSFPTGAYDLSAAASNRNGGSSATASIEIV